MAEQFIITDLRNRPSANPWPYQVTRSEIIEQLWKVKKMSFKRYNATLDLMLEEQPAIEAFLGSLPFDRPEFEKNEEYTLALAVWLAYKQKFNVLRKVEDQYIGVDLSVAFEPPALQYLIVERNRGLRLFDEAFSLLPFTMMLNGLEATVKPPQYPGSLGETFRKRVWLDNYHYLTKAVSLSAPGQ